MWILHEKQPNISTQNHMEIYIAEIFSLTTPSSIHPQLFPVRLVNIMTLTAFIGLVENS